MVYFEQFVYNIFQVLTFSLTLKFSRNFFFLAAYFFLLYLSSLSHTFFERFILLKLNSVLNFSLDRDFSLMTFGLIPYFSLLTLFIFSADCLTIVTAGILAFFYEVWLLVLIFYFLVP